MTVQTKKSSVYLNLGHAQSVMGGTRRESDMETTHPVRPFSRVLHASSMLSFDVRAILLSDRRETADVVEVESKAKSTHGQVYGQIEEGKRQIHVRGRLR